MFIIFYTSNQIAYVRTGGGRGGGSRPLRTHCVHGGGGGQKLAKFCVRTLWMAPYGTTHWAQNFVPRKIYVGLTWDWRGTWDMGLPTYNIRILYVGKPTVGKPTYFPRILYVYFPTYNIRGQKDVYYAYICPRILYVGKYTYFIRIFAHV